MQTPTLMSRILKMLAATEPHELGCDDCFDVLDEFVEAYSAGEDVTQHLPLVYKHLATCADCCEEYEALLSIISAQTMA